MQVIHKTGLMLAIQVATAVVVPDAASPQSATGTFEPAAVLESYLRERRALFDDNLFVVVCDSSIVARAMNAGVAIPELNLTDADTAVVQKQCSRGTGGVTYRGVVLPTLLIRHIAVGADSATVDAEFMRGPASVLLGREAMLWRERVSFTRNHSAGRWVLTRFEFGGGQRIFLRSIRAPAD